MECQQSVHGEPSSTRSTASTTLSGTTAVSAASSATGLRHRFSLFTRQQNENPLSISQRPTTSSGHQPRFSPPLNPWLAVIHDGTSVNAMPLPEGATPDERAMLLRLRLLEAENQSRSLGLEERRLHLEEERVRVDRQERVALNTTLRTMSTVISRSNAANHR